MFLGSLGIQRESHLDGRGTTQAHEEEENMELVEGDPSKTTKVGKELQRSLKDELVKFLKQNLDVFAWSHEDMPGIDE